MKSQSSHEHLNHQESGSQSVNSELMNSLNSQIMLKSLVASGQLSTNSRTIKLVYNQSTSRQQIVNVVAEQKNIEINDNTKGHIKVQCNKALSNIGQVQNIVNQGNNISFDSFKQSNSSEILKTSLQIKKLQYNSSISSSKQEQYQSVLAKSLFSQYKKSKEKHDQSQSESFNPLDDKTGQSSSKQLFGKVEISNSDATIEKMLIQIKKEKEFQEFQELLDLDDNIGEKGFQAIQNQTDSSSNKSIDNVDIGAIESEFAYKDKDEGYFNEAIKHFETALAHQSQSTTNIQNYVKLLINAAEAYFEVSNFPKSAQKCQKVMQIGVQKISNHKLVINFYRIYSLCLRYLGKQDLALGYAEKALEITNRQFGLNNKQTHDIYSAIGAIYAFQKKYDKAFEYFEKSFQLAKQLNNNSQFSKECLRSLNNLGFCYNYQGNYQKNLQSGLKMQIISDTILHKDDSAFITLYGDIGLAYVHLEKYEQAEKYLRKAEDKFNQFKIEDRLKNAFLIFNFCLLEKSKGNYDQALEYLDKSELILKQKLPPNHFYLDQAKNQRETILKLKDIKQEALGFTIEIK